MGYVYLIKDYLNGTYKIGATRGNIEKRIKKLQTGNSTELKVEYLFETEYPFRLESMLHERYKPFNIINEWYDFTVEQVTEFKDLCSLYEKNILLLKSNPFFGKNLK